MTTPRPSDDGRVQRIDWLTIFASPGRYITTALLALFTAIVILLAQSVFWAEGVSTSTKVAILAAGVVTLARPKYGLVLIAGLAPLAEVGTQRLGSDLRGAEAFVLACLAGALLRGWWSRRLPRFPSRRLETIAFVFGLIVAASLVEQLRFLQLQSSFPEPFARSLAMYTSRDYFVAFHGFGMVFGAMLLLEGLAVFVWAADACRDDAAFAARMVTLVVVSAVAAALLNISHAVSEFVRSGQPLGQLVRFVMRRRWTTHVGDYNAAASFFGMGLCLALARVRPLTRAAAPWLAGALAIGVALWMTGSRTAVTIILLAFALATALTMFRRFSSKLLAVWVTLLVVVPLCAYLVVYFSSSRRGSQVAMDIRWMFLQTTVGMLRWQPLFGVGISQYSLWTRHFAPEPLLKYQLENAHDNFAQVAGELGLAGLLSFLWLIGDALWTALRGWRAWSGIRGNGWVSRSAAIAAVAFILTWLGGHPLLTPAVAYPFWIVLGAAAGAPRASGSDREPGAAASPASLAEASGRSGRDLPAVVGALACVLLAISIPARVASKLDAIDLTRISYGFQGWEQGPSGERFRWTEDRARVYVSSAAARLGIPIRAYEVSEEHPLLLDLLVDGRLANEIRMSDTAWQVVDMLLPPRSSQYVALDFVPSRIFVPSEINPASGDSRRLGVQVGELTVRSWRTTEGLPPEPLRRQP